MKKLQAPPGEEWVQDGDKYVIKKKGELYTATATTPEPKCACFTTVLPGYTDTIGEIKALAVAADVVDAFAGSSVANDLCNASIDYVLETCIVLLVEQAVACGDKRKEQELLEAKCEGLGDRLKARADVMRAAAMRAMMDEVPTTGKGH